MNTEYLPSETGQVRCSMSSYERFFGNPMSIVRSLQEC